MMRYIFAVWDASATAILVGIAGGIVGVVGPSVVALYSRFSAAGLKDDADRLALAVKREAERADRLEKRVWEVEESLRECEKGRARLEALCEQQTRRSSPPKSESA